MTKLAEAFKESGKYITSYDIKYHIGIIDFKLSNLSEEISIIGAKFYKRTAIPCGKGAVVNITVFGELKFLRKLKSNNTYKVNAIIMKKTIHNGSVKEFYNLDLELVHPKSKIDAKVKITQKVSKKETGRVFSCPQGGSIVVNR